MNRKLNQVGNGTLTVSLPMKWVRQHKLTASDEVSVIEEGSNLMIAKGSYTIKQRKAELNLDDISVFMLKRFLFEFYRQGMERITIMYSKNEIEDYKTGKKLDVRSCVRELVNRFIGMEIISQKENKITLQCFISGDEESNLESVQNRVYYLLKEFIEEFKTGLNNDFEQFHSKVYEQHDIITRFVYYTMRILSHTDISEDAKLRLFSFYAAVDRAIDKIRHLSEALSELKKIDSKLGRLIKEILDLFLKQFICVNKHKLTVKEVDELVKERYVIAKKLNSWKSKEFSRPLLEVQNLVELIVIFTETYIALHKDKYLVKL